MRLSMISLFALAFTFGFFAPNATAEDGLPLLQEDMPPITKIGFLNGVGSPKQLDLPRMPR